jgi:DUF1009 family protein
MVRQNILQAMVP